VNLNLGKNGRMALVSLEQATISCLIFVSFFSLWLLEFMSVHNLKSLSDFTNSLYIEADI
jgi:hypothetical protein